jgi:hypothetical protein
MKSIVLDLPKLFFRFASYVPAVLFLVTGMPQARAAVINAASLSYVDVSNAVAKAAVGDVVVLPAGTNGWYHLLTLSGVTLQGAGAGTGGTVIRDEMPIVSSGSGNPFIQVNANAGFPTRITQIQFTSGVTNNISSFGNNYGPEIVIYGQAANWRIDHCLFSLLSGKTIMVGDDAFGLVDHNTFNTFNRIACEIYGHGYGDGDWAAPTQFGSTNAVFVEDNSFSDGNNFGWVDISNAGRAVFRHNTCNGYYVNTHGSETTQRFRSARYVEVYNNTFAYEVGTQYQNFYTMVDIRGGSGVVYSNTANGYWSVCSLNYYRATDNDTGFLPWFGATGLRNWDSNGPALYSGVATVATNILVVPGAGWITNQWVGCTVYNSNTALSGIVVANDSQSMQFMGSRRTWNQITFNVGDGYVVHHVYPMLDQPGRGQGALLSGDSPNPVYLNEALEPVYCWGNTRTVNYSVSTAASGNASSLYPSIQENRDFYNMPRPNYTAFVYPHPLQSFTNSLTVSTNVPPPSTNSLPATNSLTPPTGLFVRPL